MELESALSIYTSDEVNDFLNQNPSHREQFVSILFQHETKSFIKNFKSERILIKYHQDLLFATLNNAEYSNTHLVSPYTNYIGYAKDSVKNFKQPWLRFFILTFTKIFGIFFKWLKINKVIQLNNTLETISVHPKELKRLLPGIQKKLMTSFPGHAIILPRINKRMNPDLYETLKAQGFLLIPTKTVHICDPQQSLKCRDSKRDSSLLRKQNYTIINHDQLNENDLKRIHELYQLLFMEKHSQCNPNLTLKYFQYAYRHKWFEFIALRNSKGIIDAFVAQAHKEGLVTCALCGYDTLQPRKVGLFRMIMYLGFNKAQQTGDLYHLGAGNEEFKLLRGSARELEYNAVYCNHLPFYRRIPWKILSWCGTHLLIPILTKNLL